MAANVIALRKPGTTEYVELETTEDACKLLQRELAWLMQTRDRRLVFYRLAADTGLNHNTIRRIAYGETHWPMLKTCLALLKALGFRVLAAR